MKTLSREEARQVYDRIGRLQDSQAFYEDPATDILVHHGRFADAHRVYEFGCGTGRLAGRLLAECLPEGAHYRAVDVSPKMVALARERLQRFGPRAQVTLSDGSLPADEPDGCCDRFVSTYVLDLLSEADIGELLRHAHRMLEPGGLLCLASLTTGAGAVSRVVAAVWSALHRLRPSLVGGCRPLDLAPALDDRHFRLVHHERVAPFAIPSEVIVAERTEAAPGADSGGPVLPSLDGRTPP